MDRYTILFSFQRRMSWLVLACFLIAMSLTAQGAETSLKAAQLAIRQGDILMRSLQVHPRNSKDAYDTLATAKRFHVDKIVWIYENSLEFNKRVRAEGMGIGTSMAENAREMWYRKLPREEAEAFVAKYTIRNLNGEQVIPEHFKPFSDSYVSHFVPDMIVPGWREQYEDYVTGLYGSGIDTLHRDDPKANWGASGCGGTFTDATVEYFRNYLEKNYSPAELSQMGVTDIATFSVRDHFKALGAPSGKDLWKWRGSPLMKVYDEAMLKATVDFYTAVRRQVEAATGRSIPWSMNGSGPYTPLDRVFDFRIGEYQAHANQPQTLLAMSRYAANEGKMQALISMVDGKWNEHPEQYVGDTRRHIATAYACGMIPLVPWDMYMHRAPRYFGTVEDFGDLYEFVSMHRHLFDGYTLAAASGLDTQAALYQWAPNKEMVWPEGPGRSLFQIGRENVFALLRTNGTSHVIHVVDWNAKPAPFDLAFSPRNVVGTEAADLIIMRPGKEDRVISGYAGGSIEIPAVSPWGLISVAPAKLPNRVVAAPQILSPSHRVVPQGTPVLMEAAKGCTVFARFSEDEAFIEYNSEQFPPIGKSGVFEAYAQRNKDGVKSALLHVPVEVFTPFNVDEKQAVASGQEIGLIDAFACISGTMQKNKSFFGGSLVLGGKTVQGLTAQGNSKLLCKVDPSWKYFTVHAGIDDGEDRRPCLRFQVWFDNQMAYESPIVNPSKGVLADIDRNVFPVALRIPEGVKNITLAAVPSGFSADQNTVIWANPVAY